MNPNSTTYQAYVQILKEELLPAMGCTEPIAIAYCAARARAVLGALPDAIEVEASGNIIKNVKSVVVPNTEGRKGLEAAAAIGVLGGDADKGYEVIASISSEVKKQLGPYLEATPIMVRPANLTYPCSRAAESTMRSYAQSMSIRTSFASKRTLRCF